MHEGNRTEIATLGEFGLIKRLTEDIKLENKESVYGVGAPPYSPIRINRYWLLPTC